LTQYDRRDRFLATTARVAFATVDLELLLKITGLAVTAVEIA
jgi:hypothetical protein